MFEIRGQEAVWRKTKLSAFKAAKKTTRAEPAASRACALHLDLGERRDQFRLVPPGVNRTQRRGCHAAIKSAPVPDRIRRRDVDPPVRRHFPHPGAPRLLDRPP